MPDSVSPGAASDRPGHVPWNSCAALGRCAAGRRLARGARRWSRCRPRLTTRGSWRSCARALGRWRRSPNRRQAARGSFTWRTIDEELLALTHDSLELADAAVRGVLDVRTLGFESDGLSLEVEVDGDRVVGQVLDADVDEVVVESVDDGSQTTPVDSSGIFSVVVPTGPVRFGVRIDGVLRRTPWIVLVPGPTEPLRRSGSARIGTRSSFGGVACPSGSPTTTSSWREAFASGRLAGRPSRRRGRPRTTRTRRSPRSGGRGEMGVATIGLPEATGGGGGSLLDLAVALEACAAELVPGPVARSGRRLALVAVADALGGCGRWRSPSGRRRLVRDAPGATHAPGRRRRRGAGRRSTAVESTSAPAPT